ncbi:MAG TPA: hypothetical protein VD887_09350 [Allosphingosinicella sp.]|nr:hypothetical protein [Allosphingosinicella sp.]
MDRRPILSSQAAGSAGNRGGVPPLTQTAILTRDEPAYHDYDDVAVDLDGLAAAPSPGRLCCVGHRLDPGFAR